MQVIWEAGDIIPGRRYGKKEVKERWMIGFLSAVGGDAHYVSVSDQDGMVTSAYTKEQLARALSEGGYFPIELLQPIGESKENSL